MEIADIVVSLNGRDAGRRFMVISTEDGYSLIADGRGRRLEKPKRKKNKHLIFEDKASGKIASLLEKGEKITNKELRHVLAEYAERYEKKDETAQLSGKAEKTENKGGVPKCRKTT